MVSSYKKAESIVLEIIYAEKIIETMKISEKTKMVGVEIKIIKKRNLEIANFKR